MIVARLRHDLIQLSKHKFAGRFAIGICRLRQVDGLRSDNFVRFAIAQPDFYSIDRCGLRSNDHSSPNGFITCRIMRAVQRRDNGHRPLAVGSAHLNDFSDDVFRRLVGLPGDDFRRHLELIQPGVVVRNSDLGICTAGQFVPVADTKRRDPDTKVRTAAGRTRAEADRKRDPLAIGPDE